MIESLGSFYRWLTQYPTNLSVGRAAMLQLRLRLRWRSGQQRAAATSSSRCSWACHTRSTEPCGVTDGWRYTGSSSISGYRFHLRWCDISHQHLPSVGLVFFLVRQQRRHWWVYRQKRSLGFAEQPAKSIPTTQGRPSRQSASTATSSTDSQVPAGLWSSDDVVDIWTRYTHVDVVDDDD